MLPRLSLVLGGAASGKSVFAENLLESSALKPVYLATAQALDAEFSQKISVHKMRRAEKWSTLEVPGVLTEALSNVPARNGVLLDCATMWLSNRLMIDEDLSGASEEFLRQISACKVPLVIVSNELGQGVVPDNALARAFREAQGRLNIAIARQADLVVFVTAGLPQVLKGRLP